MQRLLDKIDNSKSFISPMVWFLAIWLVINMIQSYLTGLAHDEAYYWMYSRYPAWGYFDHPPMIALIIKAGYMLLKNELGVRLFVCILSTGTLFFLYKLIDHKDKRLSFFIILVLSIGMVSTHVCGWIAIPDTPVIFFVAVFFYLYKKYLADDSLKLAVLLALVISLMLYSKYHAVLIIFFTLISNIGLFKRKSFWIIVILSVLLMIPHLIWQINNNFLTFNYHLIARSSTYKIDYTLNYFLGQLFIAGPAAAPIILFHAFKFKYSGPFERALKYSLIGTFVFFFLSSFKGRVEPHWTAIAYIPLIILSYKSIIDSRLAKIWLQRIFLLSISFAFFIRIALIFDFFPQSWILLNEFHGWEKWADEIKEAADGRKVVFTNKYQYPSKYSFYTGEFAHSLNNINYRKNQYDIWNFEDSIQGGSVMLIHNKIAADSLITSNDLKHKYDLIDNFTSYHRVNITIIRDNYIYQCNSEADIIIIIENPTDKVIDFSKNINRKSSLCYSYSEKGRFISSPLDVEKGKLVSLNPHSCYLQKIKINTPETPGKYDLHISIKTSNLSAAANSSPIKIKAVQE